MTQKKKKSKKGGQYLAALLFLLLGMSCGILIARYLESKADGELPIGEWLFQFSFLLVAMYIAMFLQIILHEAGHLVFGLLTGYRFSSFRIGSLMWLIEDGKLKLRKMSLAGTGGQCLMCPPDWTDDGNYPYILYNLGGSFLNLLTVPFCIGAYFLFRHISYLPLFFAMMGLIGLVFALLNGIPMRPGAVDNDGRNTRSISRSPAARRSFWIQLKINEQNAKGIRLKDMPDEWFRLPADDEMQNSMTAAIAFFYENRLMDAHAFDEAAQCMDWILALDDSAITGLHKNLLACDRLYCELIRNRDSQIIRNLQSKELGKFRKQMKKFPSIIRTGYALALLDEKDTAKAAQIKKQFETCALSYPYPSDVESERELMQIAEEAARTAFPAIE